MKMRPVEEQPMQSNHFAGVCWASQDQIIQADGITTNTDVLQISLE